MADPTKHLPMVTDLKGLFSILKTRKTVAFAYGFMFAFVGFTLFMMLHPSTNSSSPWFTNIFTTNTKTTSVTSTDSDRSHFSSIFSYFFPSGNNSFTNISASSSSSSSQQQQQQQVHDGSLLNHNASEPGNAKPEITPVQNTTKSSPVSDKDQVLKPDPVHNTTKNSKISDKDKVFKPNHRSDAPSVNISPPVVNGTSQDVKLPVSKQNQPDNLKVETPKTANSTDVSSKQTGVSDKKNGTETTVKSVADTKGMSNYTAALSKKNNGSVSGLTAKQESDSIVESLAKCDFFDGEWVKDESYPLYKPGSCSLIDEQFNCVINGRPDRDYQKYKWKPKKCSLPRLNASHMLEMLRGKRLVFVGDSLNRNMWESLVCILRGSVKDKTKVYEVNGRHHFRGEASYSFVFEDYNCTVEFFVSPFLVREWEMSDKNGSAHETLRLDLIGRSCDQYKDADIIIFNTGHWWTHEKTSKGKDYYQEGSHVYGELNVLEAFRKALTTWARWVDASINPVKSLVFFRGYSDSHFSGGQWNSGGQCDSETQPIKNDKYLRQYPPKMNVLEWVLRGMKTHVTYLNITRMTDYRKDGHPSIYRKQHLSDAERRSPLRFQDCSHWCLPGVPDAWNEILYSELLVKLKQREIQREGR